MIDDRIVNDCKLIDNIQRQLMLQVETKLLMDDRQFYTWLIAKCLINIHKLIQKEIYG